MDKAAGKKKKTNIFLIIFLCLAVVGCDALIGSRNHGEVSDANAADRNFLKLVNEFKTAYKDPNMANERIVESLLVVISTAAEQYAYAHKGDYPNSERDLRAGQTPHLLRSYCGKNSYGYTISCSFSPSLGYEASAVPRESMLGLGSYKISTGGIFERF